MCLLRDISGYNLDTSSNVATSLSEYDERPDEVLCVARQMQPPRAPHPSSSSLTPHGSSRTLPRNRI